ncbi:epidermal differentiation-specific protein-like [Hyperolius riggenbachi]|uniref:epidermal differentiation-specific protein-like n=1 Tax=Hyperolius riggenbachi TaxID=752182 RepID=UPI0035A27299
MSTLELFEFPGFKGDYEFLDDKNPDLSTVGFDQKAQSLKVIGDPWVVFTDHNYKGDFRIFTEGECPSIPAWSAKIRSAKIVRGGLYNPEITLYEGVNYEGKKLPLKKAATSLKSYGFDDMTSSQKDVKGAWILYSEDYYKGDHMVAVTGDDIPDYHSLQWGDKVSSLKPFPPVHLDEVSE